MGAAHISVVPMSSLPAGPRAHVTASQPQATQCLVVFGGYHTLSFKPNTDLYILPITGVNGPNHSASHGGGPVVRMDAQADPNKIGGSEGREWLQVSATGLPPPFAFGSDQTFTLPKQQFATFPWVNGSRSDKETSRSMVGFHSMHVLSVQENGIKWTQRRLRGEHPCPRTGFATEVVKHSSGWKLYLYGGMVVGHTHRSDFYTLDLTTLAWEMLSPLPPPPVSKRAFTETLNSRPLRLAIGRARAAGESGVDTEWEVVGEGHGTTPNGRGRGKAKRGRGQGCGAPAQERMGTRVASDGPGVMAGHSLTAIGPRLYLFGGLGYRFPQSGHRAKLTHLNDVHEYDTSTNRWSFLQCIGQPPLRRFHHSATAVGPYLVVIGGTNSRKNLTAVSMLHTPCCLWSTVRVSGSGPYAELAPRMRPSITRCPNSNSFFVFGGGSWKTMEFQYDSQEQDADLHKVTIERKAL